ILVLDLALARKDSRVPVETQQRLVHEMGGPGRGELQRGQMIPEAGVLGRAGCARRKEARTKRGDLRRAGVEIALCQPLCAGEGKIRVDQELVFVKTPWQAVCRKAYAVGDLLRSRNEESSVGNLEIQELERYWIDVGTVASQGNAAEGPGLPAELLAERASRAVVA